MSKQLKKQERGHSEKKGANGPTSEIKVSTGLPPQVDGQIRCFCTLSVPQVIWTVPKPPGRAQVRVKWWGETGGGILFRPYDIKKGGKSQHNLTTAKYAVRSGPVQFATYLKDMGSLKLDVLTPPKSDVCGQAQVPNLGLLTSSKPINGFFPVVSSHGEKLANLQVSLVLEPVENSEDNEDMVPTTDSGLHDSWNIGDAFYNQVRGQPSPHLETTKVSQPGYSISNFGVSRQSQEITNVNSNKGKVTSSPGFQMPKHQAGDKIMPVSAIPSIPSAAASQGRDLLSLIVDRGTKLREAMVISSLPGEAATAVSKPDAFSPSKLEMALLGSPQSVSDFVPSPFRNMEFQSEQTSTSSDMFDPALNMLADPLMDNSLLQDLFFLQAGVEPGYVSQFGDQNYQPRYKLEQDISQPARLLGGSSENQAEDPKEDLGNKRPPSRASSLASLNLASQDPVANGERKIVKRKARSRSRSKSTTRSRSRSVSNTRTDSRSNTPRKSAKVTKKTPYPKENTAVIPKAKIDSKPTNKVRSRSRSSSRSRSRSRRRKRASADESSDIDLISTARSDTSALVLTPSKTSESRACLGVDVLKYLTRMHFAKINIEHLNLTKPGEPSDFPGKHKSGRRPPRPQSQNRAGTYIIEYHFPTAGSSSPERKGPKPSPPDYVTVPSHNIQNEAIVFQHKSVFPVAFDADTIDRWWRSALIFRLFHKESNGPAVLVGSGGISLKSILRSPTLSVLREIEIADSRRKNLSNSPKSSAFNSSISSFGQLKVSVTLAADSNHHNLVDPNRDQNFVKSIEKTVDLPVSLRASGPNKASVPGLPPQSPRPRSQEHFEASQPKPQMKTFEADAKLSLPQTDFTTLQLHSLLVVEEGSHVGFQGGSTTHLGNHNTVVNRDDQNSMLCNTYVVCKMLWCKDPLHSDVCWGTANPKFNFQQVTPVLLTPPLLERLKDNYVIIEVWDRRLGASGDKLIGMVKLSLQQFFLSFRDRKLARVLLNSEYPVVAIDNFMPIVDPFSGLHVGQLKVLLAMGSDVQVSNLRTVALSFGSQQSQPVSGKLFSQTEGVAMRQNQHQVIGKETHEFSVQIDGVTGLKLSDNMIWGEADCFIQFFFPAQDDELKDKMPTGDGLTSLKCYRTVTTLCVPDAAFHDTSLHKLTLPAGVPVQRELLTACAKSSGCVSGLSFEVWCRYYQPNIRDQLIAKCVLPLAKLSAMITMHKPGEQCVQAFAVKLSPVGADAAMERAEPGMKSKSAGTLNFSITYRKQQTHTKLHASPADASRDVCLSIGVLRACGLKSAADHVAQFDPTMKYPADVGLNAYVRIYISLFGKENEKMTKTIAKSFAPEFSYFMDISCPLVTANSQCNSVTSLAELLESGVATFEVWHQVAQTAYQDNQQKKPNREGILVQKLSQHCGDVLLGTSVVPLTSLLSRRTGLNGWFPINVPSLTWERSNTDDEIQADSALDQAIGGLELCVKFSHQDDLDRVVTAARNVGWSSPDLPTDQMDWHEEDEGGRSQNITIVIDHVSFPTELAVSKGDLSVNKTAKSYVRYKFYDKAAVVTKSGRLKNSGKGVLVSGLSHRRDFTLSHTAPLQWYLREEKLEIQVWLTAGCDESSKRSRQRDKWIGSCYVDLESLTGSRRGRQRVSGLFPLFKPGTDSLKSAFVKVDIVSRLSSTSRDMKLRNPTRFEDESESVSETEQSMDNVQMWARNFTIDKTPSKKGQNREEGSEDGTSFGVLVAIERAMHLPMVTDRNRSGEVNPTTYVSYQSAERSKPSCTPVVPNSCSPTWDYAVETRLNTQYLYVSNKNLVLKVWHKPADAPKTPDKSCDKVLGFVSVDLGPLSKGLQQICGWYNILDFNGQCKGQIKVSLTPQDHQPVSVPLPSSNSFKLPMFGTSSSSLLDSHSQSVADQLVGLQQQLKHWMASQTSRLFSGTTDSTAKSNPPASDEDSSCATGQYASSATASVTEYRPKLDLTTVSEDTPTSYLFSSLRRQLEDLDMMTQKMKLRLSTSDSDTGQPAINSGRSADILNGTVSGLSTIRTASSLMNTRERFNVESSENGVSQELSHSRSINISTLEFPADGTDKPEEKSAAAPSGRFFDSGVFSSKNFHDRSGVNDPESQPSGRTVSSDPPAQHDSSVSSAHRGPGEPELLEMFEPGTRADYAGKTQPFIPAGDSSETSGNSHGFLPDSQRVNDTNTLTSVNFPASRSEAEKAVASTSSDAVSTLGSKRSQRSESLKSGQTLVLDDGGDCGDEEDETKREHDNSIYGSYHRYRALLDEEEEDRDKADKRYADDEEVEDEVVEVVPRSLNNMSTVLALQAKDDLDVSEETKLPHGVNWDSHHGNDSFKSGDHDDSFFQEVTFRKNDHPAEDGAGRNGGFARGHLEDAVSQVQSLQLSEVEDWLEKHVVDSKEDDDTHRAETYRSDDLQTRIAGNFPSDGENEDDQAQSASARSSMKERSLTIAGEIQSPPAAQIEQDVRLQLHADGHGDSDGDSDVDVDGDGERDGDGDELPGNDFSSHVADDCGVWRQDIEDSSDEETSQPRQTSQPEQTDTLSAREVDRAAGRLNDLHLAGSRENELPYAAQMECLSKVELEMSSNSSQSHRSASGQAAHHSTTEDRNLTGVSTLEHAGHYLGPASNLEYPFTLELEDLQPSTVKLNDGDRDVVRVTSPDDQENSPMASRHSTDSRGSHGSNRLDKTEDSWASKEESCRKTASDLTHGKVNCDTERAEIAYGETNVDSTVDSAYVDSDTCHPSSAGINNSSKGAGSVYSFMQDDSGVGQLSRTISGESTRIKFANFFMPAEAMEASLRAVQAATSESNRASQKNMRAEHKVKAASQLVNKLAERRPVTSSTSVKNKRPPSAQEAKRIAKIFTSKAS